MPFEELPNSVSHGKAVVFHGQYPDVVFVEGKTLQECELAALGIKTQVVNDRRCCTLV
jgi:hypothetical protein